MRSLTDIRQKIVASGPKLLSLGIKDIGLFGSYLHGAEKPDSDIDVLIDFQQEKETFDNFMAVCELLDNLFEGQKVDVVTKRGLSPFIGPHILNQVEYVKIAH